MDGNTVEAVANALGIDDVNSLQSAIDNMHGNTVDAKVNTDGQKQKINTFQSWIDGIRGKTVSVVVNTFKNIIETVSSGGKKKSAQRTGSNPDGKGDVNGTANMNGTAFADGTSGKAFKQGDWRTKKTETALTGELGQELVVTGNRWYTVGDHGAEFATIPKGSIVFNHKICGVV
jgi:ABC-type uncharacterized transport system YnjBCD substrate-binding protein